MWGVEGCGKDGDKSGRGREVVKGGGKGEEGEWMWETVMEYREGKWGLKRAGWRKGERREGGGERKMEEGGKGEEERVEEKEK